ncbi:MAG: ATP-dependent DNA helicase PcrA [Gemmatimonas sp.]|nr:ATP-dependent DNA helicase PcrA [Gemmatimonas sp.]
MSGATPFPTLNPAQRAAVEHGDGPLLVVAGAGSGKTRVLTARIARLIAEHGVLPQEILAVTFTNKAAGEMRERVGRALGEEPKGMWIGTFHGIGARLLRANAELVGRTPEYTIYDQGDLLVVIKRLMKKHGISADEYEPKGIANEISSAMNALVDVAEFEQLARTGKAQAAAKVYRDLEETLRAANAVCFDDLLVLPVRILRQHDDVRTRLARRFRHVLVDEYQDTNRAQYEFVRLVAGEHRNVAVVGDDDQAIYGWRGADIRNILDFERDYPNAKVVRLEENYRSSASILDLANTVISANLARRGKTLRATRGGGEKVVLLEAADDRDEAEAIAEAMQEWRRSGRKYADAAVLYRTNAQSRGMEDAMRRAGVPYRLVGATRFYDRQEIRDLVAWLRLVANPQDDEAFRRAVQAPKRGIGDTSVEMLAAEAAQAGVPLLEMSRRAAQGLLPGIRPALKDALDIFVALVDRLRVAAADTSVNRLLLMIVEESGYSAALRKEGKDGEDRLANVSELVNSAAEVVIDDGGEVGLRPLDHFLQSVTLVTALDQIGPDADAITMMTVHTAKGLEYGFVCVTGLEDRLFPLIRYADEFDGGDSNEAMEEERRLLYVAITRAGERLYLSWARQRLREGRFVQSQRSRLLDNLDESSVEMRKTIRLRSTTRLAAPSREPSWRRGPRDDRGSRDAGATGFTRSPKPAWSPRDGNVPSFVADEESSQDLPSFTKGERVSHAKFGSGSIAEVSGGGKDAKVTVDFDDESIGRKRLVIAFAGLTRAFE